MNIVYNDEEKLFTESKLIAYIGNKRRLLPLLQKAISVCKLDKNKKEHYFIDPFAGSGVVSRFAKTQGFTVISNDWEDYTEIINSLYIKTDKNDLPLLFADRGGIENVLSCLNNLSPVPYSESYIAKNYCPFDTNNPNLKNERLFYTRETGEKIDAIRNKIEEWYPEPVLGIRRMEKRTLLALLLYEAATRANTSGVFKGFHNGFGGGGKDALHRILKPLTLEMPVLYNGNRKHRIFKTDATKLLKRVGKIMEADIAYLDPPYNQHQYGSNYHLLNTIARNDKPPINQNVIVDGKKLNKAAIRKDWIKTKSPYCYRDTALTEFKSLISAVNAQYILISYSIDGIIPFDDMLNILSGKGKLDIISSRYTKYRGGKQALTTKVSNIEFVLVVDTHKPSNPDDTKSVNRKLMSELINYHLDKYVSIDLLLKQGFKIVQGNFNNTLLEKNYKNSIVQVNITDNLYFSEETPFTCFSKKEQIKIQKQVDKISNERYGDSEIEVMVFSPGYPEINYEDIDYEELRLLEKDLSHATNLTKDEEINLLLEAVINLAIYANNINRILSYLSKVPTLFKKYNNRKAYLSSLIMGKRVLETIEELLAIIPELKTNERLFRIFDRIEQICITKLNFKNHQNTQEIASSRKALSETLPRILNQIAAMK